MKRRWPRSCACARRIDAAAVRQLRLDVDEVEALFLGLSQITPPPKKTPHSLPAAANAVRAAASPTGATSNASAAFCATAAAAAAAAGRARPQRGAAAAYSATAPAAPAACLPARFSPRITSPAACRSL